MKDRRARKAICRIGQLLVQRGLVHGTTGNISVRTRAGFLLTPTGVALDALQPEQLASLSAAGDHLDGDPPTKEFRLHLALYGARPHARAVVHTHSTHSVAVSLLPDVDGTDMLAALTPYYVMRVGRCALSPYRIPGSAELAADIAALAADYHVIMLARHGPVVAGPTLEDAMATLEELEATARLQLLLRGTHAVALDSVAIAELHDRFPLPPP